jgi:hypothetical protein
MGYICRIDVKKSNVYRILVGKLFENVSLNYQRTVILAGYGITVVPSDSFTKRSANKLALSN